MSYRTERSSGWLRVAVVAGLSILAGAAGAGERGRLPESFKWQQGPGEANVGKVAAVKLPEGYLYAGSDDAQALLKAMGNPVDSSVQGLMAPGSNLEWFVVFIYEESGYVKDDEKKDLNADKMLAAIKEGEEETNKARRKEGYTGLTAIGWEIPPRYNETTHNLEWAIKLRSDEGRVSINHRTKLLGREGVMDAILVTGEGDLLTVLPTFASCLAGYQYKSGQKYAEYRQGDKLAKYGLTALVVGGGAAVAAKMGFFGLIAAKLGKLIKPIILGIVALFAAFGKYFKRLFGVKTDDKI